MKEKKEIATMELDCVINTVINKWQLAEICVWGRVITNDYSIHLAIPRSLDLSKMMLGLDIKGHPALCMLFIDAVRAF